MMRRLVSLVLGTILLAGNIAAVDCAGWQSSANDRMACCMKAHDGCPDQLAADRCCAAGELARQGSIITPFAAIPVPALPATAVQTFVVEPSLAVIFRSRPAHPESPPHLRRTVLLI